MRNTGASSKVTVDALVRATWPDVILTIEAIRVDRSPLSLLDSIGFYWFQVLYMRGACGETKEQFLQCWEAASALARRFDAVLGVGRAVFDG